jgi:predicted NBD/HSP70 family sugar kinase
VLGVDLGGTKVRAALADTTGDIVAEQTVPTDPRGGLWVVDQIAELARAVCRTGDVQPEQVRATAIGSAGVLDPRTGSLGLSPNIAGLDALSLGDELAARLGHPVVVDNDVNMAAVGEQWRGHGQDHEDFVFLAVGTGIGMGIISGGRVLRGTHGAAGEVGFLPLGADPFDPANQSRGPLEEAVAGATVAARYLSATGAPLTTREVFDRAAAGDPDARDVVAEEGRLLALAIVVVCAVLDPALVVLGGGVGSRPELLEPTRSSLAQLHKTPVDVRGSVLGHRASVVGAVCLALRAATDSERKDLA